jgi:RimJ/RimL family protein N-acetyltransferase
MRLSKYGIDLERLTEKDLELVRTWRNSPLINQFMEYREHITPEKQLEWFKSVDNFDNYYFIIEYERKKIGLINSSHVQWDTISSEGGIFLWDESYYETFVPVWASLCLLETCYFILGADKSYIKTLRDNERAKKLNLHLGYVLMEGQEEVYNQNYILTRDSFKQHVHKLMRAATLLAGDKSSDHNLFFDREDILSGLADFFYEKIRKEMIQEYSEQADGRLYIFKPTMV